MHLTRRGWNNVIIIGVLVFIAVIQLPELLRARFTTVTASVSFPAVITLLPQDRIISRLLLPDVIFQNSVEGWHSDPPLQLDVATVIKRWQTLQGTQLTAKQLQPLKSQLFAPKTIEVWFAGQSQPQRITAYQFPQFWLFNNGVGQWLAVTVAEHFLFPPIPSRL